MARICCQCRSSMDLLATCDVGSVEEGVVVESIERTGHSCTCARLHKHRRSAGLALQAIGLLSRGQDSSHAGLHERRRAIAPLAAISTPPGITQLLIALTTASYPCTIGMRQCLQPLEPTSMSTGSALSLNSSSCCLRSMTTLSSRRPFTMRWLFWEHSST